jgi:peptidoglycan-associated lipoprotein
MTSLKTSAMVIVLAGVLAACSSTPLTPPASAPSQGTASPSASGAAGAGSAAAQRPAPAPMASAAALPAHLDPKSPISTERSVYFDFDEFAIKNDDVALIERHGKYLAARPALAIRIEGHTDERGGTEYNLALGQRRAEAVLRALRVYGVNASQMEAVSWGESRPKAMGADEAAWAQNRRADLQYPSR